MHCSRRSSATEAKNRRGKLKIFFGASAGVGKTYAMLSEAREKRAEGCDVVVGVIETHGRTDTAALLEGLEVLPSRVLEYRGTQLREFDLDGALKRHPTLILVDELAHTNAEGSRHPKRWNDIEELLDAGIDVYSTLNVQHLESLNDIVGGITQIRVWETIPDTVFERADEVELVDLPPDDLLERLREGKVYLPQQAERAIRNFFRKGNLIALRELALRRTAERVDAQMRDYREDHAILDVWRAGERVLVCIGPNPLAERLIRAGKRLASSTHADWIVAYVETPQLQRLAPAARDQILGYLRHAEELGAETATLSGQAMSGAILEFAREKNVSRIVLGRPTRVGWRRWLLGSVVDTIVREAHDLDIYLLASDSEQAAPNLAGLSLLTRSRAYLGLREQERGSAKKRYPRYVWGVAVTALTTAVSALMFGYFDLVEPGDDLSARRGFRGDAVGARAVGACFGAIGRGVRLFLRAAALFICGVGHPVSRYFRGHAAGRAGRRHSHGRSALAGKSLRASGTARRRALRVYPGTGRHADRR